MKVESWKEELDRKYEEATSAGDIEKIDKANRIILDAIAALDKLKFEFKGVKKWVEAL